MAGILQKEGIAKRVPYQGLVTFWRCDHTQNLEGADLAVYGIPFDVEIFNRPGARYGPRGIREQSLYIGMPGVHWPFDYDLRDRLRLIDFGDIAFYPGQTTDMLANVEENVTLMSEKGIGTLGLGGDHLVAYPAIKAHAKKYGKLSLIHFDAHTDTHGGPVLNHGSMFIYAANEGLIDPKTSVQIGIRTIIPENDEFNVFTSHECIDMGSKKLLEKIRNIVGERPCYISLDVDGMDPAYAPGTGTPVPGGITSAMQREILWGLVGLNAVGGDVVEVSPPYDPSHITAILGATIAMDILYVLAVAPILVKQRSKSALTV
ncbi:MAG: agmatinase [Candidatus Melainabacteria bacterium]|nr:MAG: agmatinase [Candidatus Melainabacteria bacterium]